MRIDEPGITPLLESLHAKLISTREGRVATYIPGLAHANPDLFALAVASVGGEISAVGDISQEFTLQSLSKPLVYGLALQEFGRDGVRLRVGVEPTGEAFDSIIELERHTHRPFNPMINSGAIAISSMIETARAKPSGIERVLDLFGRLAGRNLRINKEVYASERATAHRNRAIAHLLRHFGVIDSDTLEPSLDLYFRQCSTLMNVEDLAKTAATLANGGVQPWSGKRVISNDCVRDMLSLMFTCGMYDTSGEWAYTVGIPAKSGVSGGILAVVPGRMGIAAYSPPLDAQGHSVRGKLAIRELSEGLNLSVFTSHERPS